MSDINKTIGDIASLKIKILGDLQILSSMLSKTSSDMDSRFREEFIRQNGKVDGLEDLYTLNRILKKNSMFAKNAHTMLVKMSNTNGYEVSEDYSSDKEIQEIFEG